MLLFNLIERCEKVLSLCTVMHDRCVAEEISKAWCELHLKSTALHNGAL
jgi:hypothetical protein